MNFASSIEYVFWNSRILGLAMMLSALCALMSGCYASSILSHIHLATLTTDTVCTRSLEDLIYLTNLNVMMVLFPVHGLS